jgi:SAM-dependent methyltransferase
MDEQALIEGWKREAGRDFRGWDFSDLAGRWHEEQPPWSYDALVRDSLPQADSVLDMGTGGGERLLQFREALPRHTVATEGYPPNVPIARSKLEPHGIRVVEYEITETPRMPFEDESFELIINRHEAFDAAEVARILKSGGTFLTEQQGTLDGLAAEFGMRPRVPHVTLESCSREIAAAGLIVVRGQEWVGRTTFADVGALVYFLKAIPWEAPDDFSIDRYRDVLLDLHRRQRLSFAVQWFVVQVRKPH